MFKSSKVRVIKNSKTGKVINQSENNPDYGYVVLEQTVESINGNGWLDSRRRVAVLPSTMETLNRFNFTEGQELDGKLVIKESTKGREGQKPKIYPKGHINEGKPCLHNGEMIYRNCFITLNEDEQDVLLSMDTDVSKVTSGKLFDSLRKERMA